MADILSAALRVLTARSEHNSPEGADVDTLQCFAGSQLEISSDELACDAIQKVLKDRAEFRALAARHGLTTFPSAQLSEASENREFSLIF